MGTSDGVKPADWAERDAAGAFAGWFEPPRAELLKAVVVSLVLTAPGVIYLLAFGDNVAKNRVLIVIPLTWGLFALAFWLRLVALLLRLDRFRIERGRLSLR